VEGFDSAYVSAFALTWLTETMIYLAAFTSLGWIGSDASRRLTIPQALVLVLGVNLLSHPLLWTLATAWDSTTAVVLAEVGVVLLEGTLIALVLCRRWHRQARWAYAAALLANACSFGIGLLVALALSAAGSAACCW
jgi:hypothetical protein